MPFLAAFSWSSLLTGAAVAAAIALLVAVRCKT